MTTPRHVRTSAARLAGSAEERVGAAWSFRVAGVEYARTEAGSLVVWIGPEESAARLDDVPGAEACAGPPTGAGTSHGLQMSLSAVNGMQVNALLAVAHGLVAHGLMASRGSTRPPADGGDLPARIGRPATRALHGAGIFTLEQMAGHRRAEIAALHGVGPAALRILTEALAASPTLPGHHWGADNQPQTGTQQSP